ncbi:YciI family protein [Sphingobium sp.]|uniref:YciI family protein n=1 Tax=Sphingobium sp. TaxID=1912891 RepID=UPI002CD62F16|nr:YciI family protein [Sphingobium sp.]HUD94489.1 YciI family protein [Sphingobium sp.]
MFFMILAPDRPDMLERRLAHRPAHVDYWVAQGDKLKVAGAMLESDAPDATPIGSSFLIEAEDEAAVRALIAADPFMIEGIFGDDVTVQPVRPALGVWRPA